MDVQYERCTVRCKPRLGVSWTMAALLRDMGIFFFIIGCTHPWSMLPAILIMKKELASFSISMHACGCVPIVLVLHLVALCVVKALLWVKYMYRLLKLFCSILIEEASTHLLFLWHGVARDIAFPWMRCTSTTDMKWNEKLYLPPFSLIHNFGKRNTRGNVSKISVNLACYWQIRSKSANCSY